MPVIQIPKRGRWTWTVDDDNDTVLENYIDSSSGVVLNTHTYDHGVAGAFSKMDPAHCEYCTHIMETYTQAKRKNTINMATTSKSPWELYEIALTTPGIDRILVYGPPGVGKTHTACMYFKDRDIEYAQVTATEGDMVSEYRGMWVPNGDKFDWFNGLLTHAWTANKGKGMPIIVNEVDKFPMECMSILHAILDNPNIATLRLPNGATVQPGPDFRFIGTMNGVPGDLSEALQTRFQVKLEIDHPHSSAIEQLDNDVQRVADGLILNKEIMKRINYRQLLTFKEIRTTLGDEIAAQLIFGRNYQDTLGAIRLGS